MIQANIPVMMTIKDTAKAFNLPEHFVRQAVLSGRYIAVNAGRKYLVNAGKFADFLNSSTIQQNTQTEVAGIRPIPAKLNGTY